MTVFAVHPVSDVDITTAEVYGKIQYINSRYIYIDELDEDNIPDSFVKKMLLVVDQFEPEDDYLLIAGDHLQLIAMSAYLTERWGRFRVLRYDRQAKGYAVVNIDTIGN